MQLVGAFESCLEDGRAEAMGGAAGGVEDEQALGGEDAGVEVSKGLGEGAAGLVSGVEGFKGRGPAEKLTGGVEEGLNGVVDDDAADRRGGSGRVTVGEGAKLAAGGEGDVVDFGEVVVFSGEPEDGHVGAAGGGGVAGAGERGGGLQGRIERTAEEAHLLAGDHGSGAGAEGVERGRMRVLRGQEINDFRPMRGKGRRSLPAGAAEGRAIKGAGSGSAGAEVQKQPGKARNHGDGMTLGGRQGGAFRLG